MRCNIGRTFRKHFSNSLPEPKGYLDTPCLPGDMCIERLATCDVTKICVCQPSHFMKNKECGKFSFFAH